MTAFRWLDHLLERLQDFSYAVIWLSVGIIIVLASDREPPFEVLGVYPAQARPGDTIEIVAKVRRDTDRNCSASFSTYVLDKDGTRFDFGTREVSAELIRRIELVTPGVMKVAFVVPYLADPGPANYIGVLRYRCNKVHAWWPIEVTTNLPFTIL
jgi:hypothetical protein